MDGAYIPKQSCLYVDTKCSSNFSVDDFSHEAAQEGWGREKEGVLYSTVDATPTKSLKISQGQRRQGICHHYKVVHYLRNTLDMCLHFMALFVKTGHGQSWCCTDTSGMSLFPGESEPALISVGAANPKGPAGIIFFPRKTKT